MKEANGLRNQGDAGGGGLLRISWFHRGAAGQRGEGTFPWWLHYFAIPLAEIVRVYVEQYFWRKQSIGLGAQGPGHDLGQVTFPLRVSISSIKWGWVG